MLEPAAADAADDDVKALLDMDDGPPLDVKLVAFVGSVSLLKNISRLLCKPCVDEVLTVLDVMVVVSLDDDDDDDVDDDECDPFAWNVDVSDAEPDSNRRWRWARRSRLDSR